ncbi:MAG: hypothetical protein GXY26_06180 [Clostridiales bacterium]|nr:hypothetical protein [Clostridiales bacterium]
MRLNGSKRGAQPTKAKKLKERKTAKIKLTKGKAEGVKRKKPLVVAAAAAALLILSFLLMGAYANGTDKIFNNISMEGVDLGGLTAKEAANALEASPMGSSEDRELKLTLPAGVELLISSREAGCYMSAPDAAAYVYDLCHGGNFFSNTITYIRSLLGGIELTAGSGAELDADYVHRVVNDAVNECQLALLNDSVEVGEETVSIVKGASTVVIDKDEIYNIAKSALEEGNFEAIEYRPKSRDESAEKVDLKEIYDVVFREPANAVYDPETKQATEHVVGRSFNIDGAQRLWDKASVGEKIVIPLILEQPEITTEDLNKVLFADLLSQKTTSLAGSSSARINNVTKASAAINGVVLNPGEEFSYNGTVGQRTAAAGYQSAGAYSGGRVVSEIGGGICQVSSTIYYCAMAANLEITSRTCHYFGVTYLPAGLDATVSWPSPDFKFKNSSEYPIKIEALVNRSDLTATVRIYGSNPDGIRVEITTSTYSTANGYGATSYRNVYDRDGKLVSSKLEATSEYHYHSEDRVESPKPSELPRPSELPKPSENPVTPPPTPSVQPVTPSPSLPVETPVTEPPTEPSTESPATDGIS